MIEKQRNAERRGSVTFYQRARWALTICAASIACLLWLPLGVQAQELVSRQVDVRFVDCVPAVDEVWGPANSPVLVPLRSASLGEPLLDRWIPRAPTLVTQSGDKGQGRVIGVTLDRRAVGQSRSDWRWRTIAPSEWADDIPVTWYLVVRTSERVETRMLRVGGRSLEVHAIRDGDISFPSRLVSGPRSTLPEIRRLGDRLRVLSEDPRERWRIQVLEERFGPSALWGGENAVAEFADPWLRAWSDQMRARVHLAISRVTSFDRELGADVLGTLTSVVSFPSGELAPVWPVDAVSLEEFLRGVLENQGRESVLREARAYLDRHPPIGVWIIDEGGVDRGGEVGPTLSLVTIGIAELRGRTTAVSSGAVGVRASNVDTLEGHTSVEQRSLIPVPAGSMTGVVRARGGGVVRDVSFVARPIEARPPGVTVGPLRPGWRQGTFGSERLVEVVPAWRTNGMLYPEPNLDSGGLRRWWLFLECHGEQGGNDSVRVWIGEYENPDRVIRVGRDGDSLEETTGDEIVGVIVEERAEGWAAYIPIGAEEAFEHNILRMGVDRTVEGVGRWSWPRPMTGGQREPGRLAIELGDWSELPSEAR